MAQTSDPEPKPRGPRRPRGPALSVERITQEAMALINAEGLAAFSFRTLAERLGCQAKSIYHYFPSKAHLFEALVEQCIAEAADYPETGSWQDRMRAATTTYREMALKNPGFFLYFGTFRLNNRAVLTFLDRILRIFEAANLPVEARARHFRIMGYYLVGALIDETICYSRGPSAPEPLPIEVARRDFPAIMAVGPFFGTDQHKRTFDKGIEVQICSIEADIVGGD